jgi:putative transposase
VAHRWMLPLRVQSSRRDEGTRLMGPAELALLLGDWRREPDSLWLADASFDTQRQALRNLTQAFARHASKLAEYPKFKKRGRSDGFRCAVLKDIKLDQKNSRVLLPTLGWLRYRNSRRRRHGRGAFRYVE